MLLLFIAVPSSGVLVRFLKHLMGKLEKKVRLFSTKVSDDLFSFSHNQMAYKYLIFARYWLAFIDLSRQIFSFLWRPSKIRALGTSSAYMLQLSTATIAGNVVII